ncbi:hypothetical protein D3C72_2452980 [compost metagenome]
MARFSTTGTACATACDRNSASLRVNGWRDRLTNSRPLALASTTGALMKVSASSRSATRSNASGACAIQWRRSSG